MPSPGRAAPAEVAGGAGFAAALMAQFRAGDLGLLASPGLDALQLFQVVQVPVGVVLTDRKSQAGEMTAEGDQGGKNTALSQRTSKAGAGA